MIKDEEFLKNLGKVIRKYRKANGMTQDQLAAAIGSELENDRRSFISKLEAGKRNPSASTLTAIASALHITPAGLISEATAQQTITCDSFADCHGSDAFDVVQEYIQLDPEARQDVKDYIKMKMNQKKRASVPVHRTT